MNRLGLRGTCATQSIWGAPCTWQRKPISAYFSALTIPDLPSLSEAITSWLELPIEETIPIPVTTTRLISFDPYIVCISCCRAAQGGSLLADF